MFELRDKVRIIGVRDVYTVVSTYPGEFYHIQLGRDFATITLRKGSELELVTKASAPDNGFCLVPISCEQLY
jgi:hypothetical protein